MQRFLDTIRKPEEIMRLKPILLLCLLALCPLFVANADAQEHNATADWSGFYAGLAVGGTNGEADPTLNAIQATGTFFATTDYEQLDPEGSKDLSELDPSLSLFGGYNIQRGNWVYGLEAEATLSRFDEEHSTPRTEFLSAPGCAFTMNTRISSDWMASLRPRLGYAFGDSLISLSAGPALSQINYRFQYANNASGPNPALSSNESGDVLALGWAAGMAFEHVLPFEGDWRLKLEYLHYEFPDAIHNKSYDINYTNPAGFKSDLDFRADSVRLGLVKRF